MKTQAKEKPERLIYPESDGKPMADNTLQFEWIVRIQGNLDDQYRDDPNVLVVGDLLWYPVQGKPKKNAAPDTMVVFGRPKGYRGSYLQWREGDVAPQVVFEVPSPNNSKKEMARKLSFYDQHRVEEYYLYDPDGVVLSGWLRQGQQLQPIPVMHGWVSPRLQISFDLSGDDLVIFKPNGEPFLSFLELAAREKSAERRAEREKRQRETAERRAEREKRQRETAELETEEIRRIAKRQAAELRRLGIDPDTLLDDRK